MNELHYVLIIRTLDNIYLKTKSKNSSQLLVSHSAIHVWWLIITRSSTGCGQEFRTSGVPRGRHATCIPHIHAHSNSML